MNNGQSDIFSNSLLSSILDIFSCFFPCKENLYLVIGIKKKTIKTPDNVILHLEVYFLFSVRPVGMGC